MGDLMDRKQQILRHVDRRGRGIEIGPSHNPIAPKIDGFEVHIIDHMTRDELRAKYRGHGVDLERIEEVDYVWRGEDYALLTGKRKFYDWVIASHVVEHTPDLIGFLRSCDDVLKDDGVISLAVPDKRFCFDVYRPLTSLSSIIDSHLRGNAVHTPGTVAEYYLNVVSRAGSITWGAEETSDFRFVHSVDEARQAMQQVEQGVYHDVHAWCFVPHSFRLMIQDLYALGFTPFREVDFHPSVGFEFFTTISRKGTGPEETRLELLDIVERESNARGQSERKRDS